MLSLKPTALIEKMHKHGIQGRRKKLSGEPQKHGFKEVGRFMDVTKKYGESIDVVWVQKKIAEK
jgi:hypothetical protein